MPARTCASSPTSPSATTTSTSPRARARGIVVTNTPDVLTNACADFTWGLILGGHAAARRSRAAAAARRWKGWALDHMLGMELRGKRLGLVGVGRIGRAVAEKAPAFGMTVAYTEPAPIDLPGAEHLPLDHLLATSDVVSLHCPLTPETRHLIDQKALDQDEADRVSHQHLARSGRRRGGARLGAEAAADRRRRARRLRERAAGAPGPARPRERDAHSAHRQRHDRNADGDGRPRRVERARRARRARRRSRRV